MTALIDPRKLLPEVGEIRMEKPTVTGDRPGPGDPAECVVVEVNPQGLWYRVRFKETGFHECYKVPRLKPRSQGGILDD